MDPAAVAAGLRRRVIFALIWWKMMRKREVDSRNPSDDCHMHCRPDSEPEARGESVARN